MSFNYSGDPSSSVKDEIRYLLGDIYDKDPFLSDEEILYEVPKFATVIEAAISAGDKVVMRLTHLTDYNVAGEGARDSQKFYNFRSTLEGLKRDFRNSHQIPISTDSGRPSAFIIGFQDGANYENPEERKVR